MHPEEQLEAGNALWHHLERHGVSFLNFGEGFELAGVDEDENLEPTGARYLTNVPVCSGTTLPVTLGATIRDST